MEENPTASAAAVAEGISHPYTQTKDSEEMLV